MRILLFAIFIGALSFAGFYYYYGGVPDFSIGPSEECVEIREREKAHIDTTATSITVTKPEYTDGIDYFFNLCFLR